MDLKIDRKTNAASPESRKVCFLIDNQKELWIANESLPPEHPGISCGGRFLIEGELNEEAFREALKTFIEADELLTATLKTPEDNQSDSSDKERYPYFILNTFHDYDFIIEDLRGYEDPHLWAQKLERKFIETPFHPLGGKLCRYKLLRLADNVYWFLSFYFHLVAEGINAIVHFNHIASYYNSIINHEVTRNIKVASWETACVQYEEYRNTSRYEKDIAYWQKYINGLKDEHIFYSLTGTAISTGTIGRLELDFPSESIQALIQFAKDEKTSLFVSMLALEFLTLSRTFDKQVVTILVPIRLDTSGNEARTSGYLINVVPLQMEIEREWSFRHLLGETGKAMLAALRRARCPWQSGWRKEEYPVDVNPFLVTTWNQIYQPINHFTGTQTKYCIPVTSIYDPVKLGVYVIQSTDENQLHISVDYNTGIFTEEFVKRHFKRYLKLMNEVMESPEKAVGNVDIILEEEEKRFEVCEYGIHRDYRKGCINEIVEDLAREYDGNTAIRVNDEEISYKDLIKRVTSFASYLNCEGINRGDVVAVMAHRHFRLSEIILGIMKSGAVYLPVTPDNPSERNKVILEQARVKTAVIFNSEDRAILPKDMKIIEAGTYPDSVEFQFPQGDPEDIAYIIFTSGSTGSPKGVCVSHRAFVNMIQYQSEFLNISSDDCVLQFASPSFDASLSEIFMALFNGAGLYHANREIIDEPWRLRDSMMKNRVSIATLPPSYLRVFDRSNFPGLRVLLTAGESPDPADVKYYADKLTCINAYGPTETAVCAAMKHIKPDDVDSPITIGKPTANTRIMILDSYARRLPPGVPGEIYIGGAGLAHGYLDDKLNETAFIYAPFEPGLRLYRTGDLGVWTDEGELKFIGRKDTQVKIHGHRVELSEIENTLNRINGIKQSVVEYLDDGNETKILTAFIVPDKFNTTLDPSLFRQKMLGLLPSYMVPLRFISIESLPLKPSGKVDRKKLSEIIYNSDKDSSPALIDSPLNVRVRKVLKTILGSRIEDISIDADLYVLGLDSIKLMRIAHALSVGFNISVTLRELIHSTSIQAITALIQKYFDEVIPTESPGSELTAEMETLPLTEAQRQIWTIRQMEESPALYNMPLIVELVKVDLDVDRITEALTAAVEVQPSFFLAFEPADEDGNAVARIHKESGFNVEKLDFSHDNNPFQSAYKALTERIHRRFDLENLPLIRATLAKLSPNRWLLMICMHHIIGDAQSLFGLFEDFLKSLDGITPVSFKPFDLKDVIDTESEYLASQVAEDDLEYWGAVLSPKPPELEIFTGGCRSGIRTGEGDHVHLPLEAELFQGIERLAQQSGTTSLGVWVGLVQAYLSIKTGMDDIAVGIPVGTRLKTAWKRLAGYYVNTVIIRNANLDNTNPGEVIRQAGKSIRSAVRHSRYPFARLVSELGFRRDPSRTPLVDVLVTMSNELPSKFERSGINFRIINCQLKSAKFDAVFLLRSFPDGLAEAVLEFDTRLSNQSEATEILREFVSFIRSVVIGGSYIEIDQAVRKQNTIIPEDNKQKTRVANPASEENSKILLKVWNDVLGSRNITHGSDFFDEGGDSLKAIRIASKLHKYGFSLKPADLFKFPRFDQIALRLSPDKKDMDSSGSKVVNYNQLKLTPIQKWLFKRHPLHWRRFLMAAILKLEKGFDENNLQRGLNELISHHEALHTGYRLNGLPPRVLTPCEIPWITVKKSTNMPQEDLLSSLIESLYEQFSIEEGRIFGAAFIQAKEIDFLLMVGHHLSLDAVSFGTLIEELQEYLENGTTPKSKDSDIFRWAEKLEIFIQDERNVVERAYWGDLLNRDSRSLPILTKRPEIDQLSQRISHSCLLDENFVNKMELASGKKRYGVQSILLAALGQALSRRLGEGEILVKLEGHGRSRDRLNIEAGSGVGWFTAPYPFLLPLRINAELPWREIERLQEQIPNSGAGFQLFAEQLKFDCQIAFNYIPLARIRNSNSVSGVINPCSLYPHLLNHLIDPSFGADEPLDVSVLHDSHGLHLTLSFNPDIIDAEWGKSLLHDWNEILSTRCEDFDDSVYSNADTGKDWKELANPPGVRIQDIETVYPLTDAQEGMFYQQVLEGPETTTYTEQICFKLKGELQHEILSKAWQHVFNHHQGLRARFVASAEGDLRQVILRKYEIPVVIKDFSSLAVNAKEAEVQKLLKLWRNRRFELGRDSLFNIALIRLNKNEHLLVWNCHHIVIDGWCIGLLLRDLFRIYQAILRGNEISLKPAPALDAYFDWIGNLDQAEARQYWKRNLSGLQNPTRLNDRHPVSVSNNDPHYLEFSLAESETKALVERARQYGVSLPILIQTIWAGVLRGLVSERDLVFGLVTLGRPQELPGINEIVSNFIRTIPVRVTVSDDDTIESVAIKLRDEAFNRQEFEYLPLPEILTLTNLGHELFDHLLDFHPLTIKDAQSDSNIRIVEVTGFEKIPYSLCVNVLTGDSLTIRFLYNTERLSIDFVENIQKRLESGLRLAGTEHHLKIADFISKENLTETPFITGGNTCLTGVNKENNALKTVDPALVSEVSSLIQDVLKQDTVSPHDNFLALGGHSLTALRLLLKVEGRFGCRIDLHEFFKNPTPSGLSAIISMQTETISPDAKSRQAISHEQTDYSLSRIQERLWFLQMMTPEAGVYNIFHALRLNGPLDVSALERALGFLMKRHSALRIRVPASLSDKSVLKQRFAAVDKFKLEFRDLSMFTSAEEIVRSEINDSIQKPFKFGWENQLLEFKVYKLNDNDHVLSMVVHHIVMDGWSGEIIRRELSIVYAAEKKGRAPGLPELPLRYVDYVARQRSALEGLEGKRLRERWMERMTPLPDSLNLPTDFSRPLHRDRLGGVLLRSLDSQLVNKIRSFTTEISTTLFVVLLTGVKILLARLSGQNDIIVGTPVAGRDLLDLENVVGCFVNTVALRDNILLDQDFSKSIDNISATVLDALNDQAYPFESLVDDLNIPRDPSHNPLFDVLVAIQDSDRWDPQLEGIVCSEFPLEIRFCKFDLSFYFFVGNSGIKYQIEYATDIFDKDGINRLALRFENLLNAALNNPAQPLHDLPLLLEGEEKKVLHLFNASPINYPLAKNLWEALKEENCEAENLTALEYGDETLTWLDLASRAALVSASISELSRSSGIYVAILLERSPELIAAIYGTIRSGAVYVPVDPGLPEARIRTMIEDLGNCIIVTDRIHAESLDDLAAELLLVDDLQLNAALSARKYQHEPEPEDIAYVIFTSGSTGKPKGVAIEHRGLLNRLYWMKNALGLNSNDVFLLKTSISFDVSIWELFCWRFAGARLAILPQGAERDPDQIITAIERHGVTIIHFVPSMLGIFLSYVEKRQGAINRLRTLRYVVSSGEPLSMAMADHFNRALFETNGTRLYNFYGPTEATVDVTWQLCSPSPPGESIPIGRPVDNTSIYILDKYLQPLPIGTAGEIYIGGVQVAKGYINREELTNERFLTDPFYPGQRIYKSGDFGKWRSDGVIEYLGRVDNQVKVRGFRIELDEIEIALEKIDGIDRAAVITSSTDDLARLDAYLLLEDKAFLDSSIISAFLGEALPEYMIPNRFFVLDSLPLTGSGKINRKALSGRPLDEGKRIEKAEVFSDVQRQILSIWSDVLKDANFGLHDNFFEAGGDSLRLIRLHELLEQEFPGVFQVATLFSLVTVSDQAGAVENGKPSIRDDIRISSTTTDEPIAIVGMSLRLADFDDPGDFWSDLIAGADRIREIPPARRNDIEVMLKSLGYPLKGYEFREAAYLDDVAGFDPVRFRLAPVDASILDPEQRLFLETALHALEDAGMGGEALHDARVGVFVGASPSAAFRDAVSATSPERLEQNFVLNVPSNIATRLSYLKNWRGPAAVIDTACSSSLNAIHLACRAIRNGECELALVGGVKVMHLPLRSGKGFAIDSSTNRTHAFDASADGTGGGEGAVAFLLKSLSAAKRDRDEIHAVILGSAVNQDGRSIGMAAPNPASQAEVISDALRIAGVDPQHFDFVEAHGTGTALGDPAEVEGITVAFKQLSGRRSPKRLIPGSIQSDETLQSSRRTVIGSVKGNYGHLDAAAGALGLAKAVMCLKHGSFPRQPFYSMPNPRIDFAHAPVFVPIETHYFSPVKGQILGGVSSFGLSGVNVHIVLQNAPEPIPNEVNDGWCCVVISASSDKSLAVYVMRIAGEISEHPEWSIEQIAFTLCSGRDHLCHRLAITANSSEMLVARLLHTLVHWDEESGRGAQRGEVSKNPGQTHVNNRKLDCETDAQKVADSFIAGAKPVWIKNDIESLPGRIHLPVTPFDHIRCWPDFKANNERINKQDHGIPLPGKAIQTPAGSYLQVPVHSDSFWPVAEHLVGGEPTLVGMGFVALMAKGTENCQAATTQVFKNLNWLKPLRAGDVEAGTITLEYLTGDNGQKYRLLGRTITDEWECFAEAQVSRENTETPILEISELLSSFDEKNLIEFEVNGGFVRVSDRWNCREKLFVSEDGRRRLSMLKLPQKYHNDLENMPFHPAMLDVAVSLALDTDGFIPASCGKVILYKPLQPDLQVLTTVTTRDYNSITANCRIMDSHGCVLVEMLDLLFLKVGGTEIGLYGIEWDAVEPPEVLPPDFASKSVLLVGEDDIVEDCLNVLTAAGSSMLHSMHPRDDKTLESLINRAVDEGASDVIYRIDNDYEDGWKLAAFLREWLKRGLSYELRVIAAGTNAFATGDNNVKLAKGSALALGVALATAWEEPLLKIKYIDVNDHIDGKTLLAELKSFNTPESQQVVMFRNGKRFVRRFSELKSVSDMDFSFPKGSYIITGGLGAMGLTIANGLVDDGITNLALLDMVEFAEENEWNLLLNDNNPETARRARGLVSLRDKGAKLNIYNCDVADRSSLDEVMVSIRRDLGEIKGVIHTAGVAGGGFLIRKDQSEFERVLLPKVTGTLNLHELTLEDDIELFILAASRTGLTGSPGQSDYAAANTFLDAFAHWRRSQNLPALAIDWATWEGLGMAAQSGADKDSSDTIRPEDAFRIIVKALKTGLSQIAVYGQAKDKKASVSHIEVKDKTVSDKQVEPTPENIGRIWQEVLGYDRKIEPEEDFFVLGGDSITGFQVVGRVLSDTGITISLADIFSSSTLSGFAGAIAGKKPEAEVINKAEEITDYPVIWEQMGILRESALHDTGTAFNLPVFLQLPPEISRERLEEAFNKLVERHEILRTGFIFESEEPRMRILPKPAFKLKEEFHNETDIDKLSGSLIQPFDLNQSPLFRAKLVNLPDSRRILYFDIHHSIADAFSLDLLLGDLAGLYDGRSLPELKQQIKDIALMRRSADGERQDAEAQKYWLGKFSDEIPKLDLPADLPRPPQHSYKGDVVSFDIDRELLSGLRDLARKLGTTTFNLFLSAWSILINRYTGEDDFVIATALDERDNPDIAITPGMLISLVPLRLSVCIDDKPADIIRRNHLLLGEAIRHRSYNLIRLLAELAPPPAPERMTLMEVTFSYMNFLRGELGGEWSEVKNLPFRKDSSKADLAIFGTESQDGVHFLLEYYSDLYSKKRIERLGRHLLNLLRQLAVKETRTPIKEYDLVDEDELRCLDEFCGAKTPLPERAVIHDLVREQALAHPGAIAVRDTESSLTYRELIEYSNSIADILIHRGLKSGDFLAVDTDKTSRTIAILLAILETGAAYLPLDPEQPVNRAGTILRDSGCRMLITKDKELAAVAPDGCIIISPDEFQTSVVTRQGAKRREVGDSDPAYMIYTSGSTGVPKGVIVPHKAIYRLVKMTDSIRPGNGDCILQTGSIAFDASTWEIWGALTNGAQLVLLDKDELLDETALGEIIDRYNITMMWLTSSLCNRFAEQVPGSFGRLRRLITGGEVLSVHHIKRIREACPDLVLYNGYGPTENTTFTTLHRITEEDLEGNFIPIGKPIANTLVYILDRYDKLAPVGIWGEICSGGEGLALGYCNDADLTNEKFKDNPFRTGEKVYCTGDFGRWRKDGVIEFLGRKDEQVKIRGFRIELTEIEEIIRNVKGVNEAVILLDRHSDGNKELVGCLVTCDGFKPENLSSYLNSNLPAYMRPTRFYQVPDIPLTTNGKTDKVKLAEISRESGIPVSFTQHDSPLKNKQEEFIAGIFRELLKTDQVGSESNFLEMGGHSLLIFRLINRLAERTGKRLSVREVMSRPTVRDLALLLDTAARDVEAIKPADPALYYPLSHAQQRLYVQHRMMSESSVYNMPMLFEFGSEFDPETFLRALEMICDRHEIMRTGFHDEDGELYQTIAERVTIPLKINDLRGYGSPEKEAYRLIRADFTDSFDLTKPPLLRVRICRISDDATWCAITIHHIIGDGWSMRVFFREIAEYYSYLQSDKSPDLTPLSVQYKDFSVWQQKKDWTSEAAYWKRQLMDAPTSIDLPIDHKPPEQRSYRGATIQVDVTDRILTGLRRSAQARSMTIASLAFGLFSALLYRLTRQSDLVIGLGVAGRERKELENLIGFFVNILPIRIKTNDDMDLDKLLRQVNETIQAAMQRQDYPYDLLVREISSRRDDSRELMLNVVFEYQRFESIYNLQDMPAALVNRPLDKASLAAVQAGTSKYDLTLFLIEEKEKLIMRAEYNTDVLEEITIRNWLESLTSFFEIVSAESPEDIEE